MGWTGYNVYGKIDRKYECDKVYNGETEKTAWKVLKSAMVGSTYYAAVQRMDKESGKSKVFAAVCLTKVHNGEFYYKDMDESMGPEAKCPNSILKLLTEPEYETSREWRDRCRAYDARPKPGKLPIGSVIEFELNGQTYRAEKCAPAYQFKTPWWSTGSRYVKKNQIPENFRVVG